MPEVAEGVSFEASLRGETREARPQICEELDARTIHHEGWALAYSPLAGECALWQVETDPYLLQNRYAEATGEARARRYRLKRELLAFLLDRIQRPFDEDDVAALENALEGRGATPPLTAGGRLDQVFFFRAGIVVHWDKHSAFFPRYAAEPLLFDRRGDFRRADALPPDQRLLEAGLEAALDECSGRITPRAVLRTWSWKPRGANFTS